MSDRRSFRVSAVAWAGLFAIALGPILAGSAGGQDVSPYCAASDPDTRPLQACTGGYALCTSAPCIPIPANAGADGGDEPVAPTLSLCDCVVVWGANIAQTGCDARDPGDGSLISAYSFAQTATLELMTCPARAAYFTDCLNAPCKVDPDDPTRADCTCPIVPAGGAPWVTFGGGCDLETCETTLWSGATQDAIAAADCCLVAYLRSGAKPGGMLCDAEPPCTTPYGVCD